VIFALLAWGKKRAYLPLQIFSSFGQDGMALNIKDPATERLVRELADWTGETVTMAVRLAAEQRLRRVRHRPAGRSLKDELLEIGRRCAALPDLDTRSAEEIIGYGENGLPS
jgi:antitoxin VapB